MLNRIETELHVLVCDTDLNAAQRLHDAIVGSKLADWVTRTTRVNSLDAAQEQLEQGAYNAVFIDPVALGIHEAARLIFAVREAMPEVVFVLCLDPAVAERHGVDFDRLAPKRFGHYYKLWNVSDGDLVAAVETALQFCMSDIRANVSALRTRLRCELLSGRRQPIKIAGSAARFRTRFPSDGPPIGFVMMRFGEGRPHKRLWKTIRDELAALGLLAVRADDFEAHPQLLNNVRTFLHCCDFGVAVIERIENEHYNPNVSLEVGYMMALGKPICFLRDETLKTLPTDLVGLLSIPFNVEDMRKLGRALGKWVASQDFFGRMNATAASRTGEPDSLPQAGVEAGP